MEFFDFGMFDDITRILSVDLHSIKWNNRIKETNAGNIFMSSRINVTIFSSNYIQS